MPRIKYGTAQKLDGEEWRPSRILPHIEVSSLGRVRVYMQGSLDADGYLAISGGARGRAKRPIHFLVADAFLGPRPGGLVVRHLNDSRFDNRLANLAYGTKKENWADAERNGIVVRYCPKRAATLKKYCSHGWWKGKKREGCRGKVRPS